MKKKKNHSTPVIGVIKRHPDGFGFLIPEDPDAPDIYVPRHEMSGVMGNDRVQVLMRRESGGNRFRGENLEVIERSVKRVTGKFEDLGGGRGCLRDRSLAWGADLVVKNPLGLMLKANEWISVEITHYPDSAEGFSGKAVAIIGDALDPQNDSLRMLHTHNIPFEFSKAALREAQALPDVVSERDFHGRQDLRALNLITIDGKTAKDFDDAIYVETTATGFRLAVAIADVSHYVKPETKIDDEAYERGTSTYFPNFVAPMLPEKLSHELCSLNPHVSRLAFVADMQIDFQGELRAQKIYEAVIESKARVTYGEAQEVIDGVIPENLRPVAKMIQSAAGLAKILMAKRFKEGSLDLEIPETVIELDETGQPVDILQAERLFSHRLIEEMMLMANVAVARELGRRGVACLYRIHEDPNPEAVKNLEEFMSALGAKQNLSGGRLQKKITRALQDFSGHPQEHILNVLTLRSMAQARYSSHNVGHFGLGFSDYAHFTSPIRRYPDLIVHRQLKAALKIGRGYQARGEDELESAGAFLSACEQRSVKAERQIKGIKKARFMMQHLGEEFEGLITSVAKFGVFVLLRQFDVDGLVRLESLPGERYEFDEDNMWLVGRRSGRVIKVGDPMRIQVAAADSEEGRVDFVPAESGAYADLDGEKKIKPPAQRKSTENHPGRVRPARLSSGRRKGKTRKFHSR